MNSLEKVSILPNNFDLIRLVAALQVMIANHYNTYFDIGIGSSIWGAFSGVPIFLLMTGFFIPMSFEHNSETEQFIFNRILKIVPEMWASIILGVVLMFIAGYTINIPLPEFLLYVIAYMFYPMYTPDCLRGYGVGTINGALWIIPVQITFYLLIPVLYKFFNFKKSATLKIILLFALFVVIETIGELIFTRSSGMSGKSFLFKAYSTSILIHFPMLLFGMLMYKNLNFFIKLVRNRFLLFLVLHLGLYYTLGEF